MRMLQRIAQDLRAGWATLRQGAADAANRALEESELVQLRLRARKLDEQVNHLYEDIGELALARHDKGQTVERFMKDAEMTQLLSRLQRLREARAKLEAEINDVQSET